MAAIGRFMLTGKKTTVEAGTFGQPIWKVIGENPGSNENACLTFPSAIGSSIY